MNQGGYSHAIATHPLHDPPDDGLGRCPRRRPCIADEAVPDSGDGFRTNKCCLLVEWEFHASELEAGGAGKMGENRPSRAGRLVGWFVEPPFPEARPIVLWFCENAVNG